MDETGLTAPAVVERLARATETPLANVLKVFAAADRDELRFVERMVEHGLASDVDAYRIYAACLGMDFENPDVVDLDPAVLAALPLEAMRRYQALPLRRDGGTLVVAMANPMDLLAVDGVQESLGEPVLPVLCTPRFLADGIRYRERVETGIEGLLGEFDLENVEDSAFVNPQKLREIAGDDAIVQLVDYLVDMAMRRRASDVHIEPGREHLRVRYRIDGELETVQRLPKSLHSAITTRLKILSGLDIAERRKPQDGRFRQANGQGRQVEFRVSTLPSVHGEKSVLRILDKGGVSLDLASQGFAPALAAALRRSAEAPNGMVLVTGPTGSGKTTTLYGVLQHLNTDARNLVTVEDPVEYELPGITQVQVDPKAERTFSSVLRSILRQDPDVIMVGEIRDRDTAEIAVHAALTGHMLLSTLHTNSALGTVTRLVDMGLEPYLLAPTLRAIVAQRLTRRLCGSCAAAAEPPPKLLARLRWSGPTDGFRRPVGCNSCRRTGFSGRVPIHEVLTWRGELPALLGRGANEQDLLAAAARAGFEPLVVDGVRKAAAGLTSVEEVLAAVRG